MHTKEFAINGYQGRVIVNHNGDWSGEAIIRFQEEVFGSWDEQKKPMRTVEIPAKLLAALGIQATRVMVAGLLESFAEELPEALGVRSASENAPAHDRYKEKLKGNPYQNTDDTVYGTKYVYCMQHRRVHDTGWCTVAVVDKIPLLSKTLEAAQEEWDLKSANLPKRLK